MTSTDELFPEFAARQIDIGPLTVFVRTGGSGPPLLLLHGYPQTHVAWHRVAPALSRHFTIVAPDLRGYGQSTYVPSDSMHRAYSKRTMAKDAVELMAALGFDRFSVMGHGRGGRVAYRLALDRPDVVERLVVIDIMTSFDHWQPENEATRQRLAHWAFLAQPAPIPESLIGANPQDWLEGRLRRGLRSRSLEGFDPRALDAYRSACSNPDCVHAACEDFRAGASCDLVDDQLDHDQGRRIECPALLVWGTEGSLADVTDPGAQWQPWCSELHTRAVASGHYVLEDNPTALLEAALPFLTGEEMNA